MASAPYLFEISWEVCNKVGGIHTVITSKLPYALEQFGANYYAVGPYLSPGNSEFRETAVPEDLQEVAAALGRQGVTLHTGTWLTEGEPKVILLSWEGIASQANQLKAMWWERYQLDTLGSNFYDIDQPLFWSWACGLLVEAFANSKQVPVIAHGHEWLSAGLFLRLDEVALPQVKSVFTTHATVLGRALCSNGVFIYNQLSSINPEQAARDHGVTTKHQLEFFSAKLSTIFTTVSQITAQESEAFLRRKPDLVLKNGIDSEEFPPFDQLCHIHAQVRETLHSFVSAYFFPSYQFDLHETRYQFTMGRYEMHNKGYDLYLESLGALNRELKEKKSKQTVVSFLLVPGDASHLRPDVNHQITIYKRIADALQQRSAAQKRSLYVGLLGGNYSQPLPSLLQSSLELLAARFTRWEQPPISPFELRSGDNDAFIQLSNQAGLLNRAEDRVKVILLPIYLDGFDGLFNISLYELVAGFDLGVFPSLYEPWGYTPMESLALGVPAITSTLAGFGQELANPSKPRPSTFVLDRNNNENAKELAQMLDFLHQSLAETPREWLKRRMDAYSLIQEFSWRILYDNYRHAYQKTEA